MIFHSVKLMNYKSIGEKKCELIIEPGITSIIGKNESGKSNVINGLAEIKFLGSMNNTFLDTKINRINQRNNSSEIKFIITLKFTEEEIKEYGFETNTIILIDKQAVQIKKGGMLEYYKIKIFPKLQEFCEFMKANPLKLADDFIKKTLQLNRIIGNADALNLNDMWSQISAIEQFIRLQKLSCEECDLFLEIYSMFRELIRRLPTVFLFNPSKVLKQQYSHAEVQKELDSPSAYPTSLLSSFVKLIRIKNEDFINAVAAGSSGIQVSNRRKIEKMVNSEFNDNFNKFYTAEKINFRCEFNGGNVSFSIESNDGELMLMNERSNGLRWYINMFINSQINNIPNKNVLYLFDEPANSLHVNAQKEVLKLFEDLASKDNQVIFTTHSPFMLTTNDGGLHRIRAVDKSSDGYTFIYKTAYDHNISPENQTDIYAPIIKAIGMDLASTFGPAKDKLNIVCEGISDYIYLKTMFKLVNTSYQNYNFIPSTGATNVSNMCNLLHGWGCPFIAIFDYDSEGVIKGGNVMKKTNLYIYGEDYIYIKNELLEEDFEEKTYKTNPFMIEDLIGKSELVRYACENGFTENAINENKTILAKQYCTALEDGNVELTQICKKEFKTLFDRISQIKEVKIN